MKKLFLFSSLIISSIATVSCSGNASSNKSEVSEVTFDTTFNEVGEEISLKVKEEPDDTTMERSKQRLIARKHKVAGAPNIKSFVYALLPAANDYYGDPTNLTEVDDVIDLKNGFYESTQEGDGMMKMQSCFWNRTDGKKLVAFYYDSHELEDMTVTRESFLLFFLYNETTKELENIEAPFDQPISGDGHLICKLPQKGKDIRFYFGTEQAGASYSTLQWNGMGFDLK